MIYKKFKKTRKLPVNVTRKTQATLGIYVQRKDTVQMDYRIIYIKLLC